MYPEASGTLLCFLPGAPEIRRAETEVRQAIGERVDVVPLHGSLPADQQDRALAATTSAGSVILATNIAETSLTVPGVTHRRRQRYRKSRDTIPTAVSTRCRPSESPPTRRNSVPAGRDDSGPAACAAVEPARHFESAPGERDSSSRSFRRLLAIVGWGGQVGSFEWFESPDPSRIEAAMTLLARLGAIEQGQLTPLGRSDVAPAAASSPRAHTRRRRGDPDVALACAVLSERHASAGRASTTSDLLSAIDDPQHAAEPRRVQLAGASRRSGGSGRTAHVAPVRRNFAARRSQATPIGWHVAAPPDRIGFCSRRAREV